MKEAGTFKVKSNVSDDNQILFSSTMRKIRNSPLSKLKRSPNYYNYDSSR